MLLLLFNSSNRFFSLSPFSTMRFSHSPLLFSVCSAVRVSVCYSFTSTVYFSLRLLRVSSSSRSLTSARSSSAFCDYSSFVILLKLSKKKPSGVLQCFFQLILVRCQLVCLHCNKFILLHDALAFSQQLLELSLLDADGGV